MTDINKTDLFLNNLLQKKQLCKLQINNPLYISQKMVRVSIHYNNDLGYQYFDSLCLS